MEITKAQCCCLIALTSFACGTADNEQALEQGSQRAQLYCENRTEDECIQDMQCSPVYASDANTTDPNCDPATGAANCAPTYVGCEPSQDVCGPVCAIWCEYGNVLDQNGCPTCECNPPPPPDPAPCACENLAEDECIAQSHCEPEYAVCVPSEPPPGCTNGDPNCDGAGFAPQPPDECDGTPQYVGCSYGPDECLLDFICQDGSVPQGRDCECPPWPCNDATDPNCGCILPDGTALPPGSSFPSNDPCGTCWCDENGQVICTADSSCECPLDFVCADGTLPQGPNCECPPPPPPCDAATGNCGCILPNGDVLAPGETVTTPDGCGTCWCEPDGQIVCTQDSNACPPPPPPPCDATGAGCGCVLPDGQWVPVGTTFPAPDNCNTCECDENGNIVCTEIACTSDPNNPGGNG